MTKQRKKTTIAPSIKPIVPKKREKEGEVKSTKNLSIEQKVELVVEETKTTKEEKRKKTDFKTIRIAFNANIEERKHIADRVQKGELSLAYYAVDGDNSYHYYFVNKN